MAYNLSVFPVSKHPRATYWKYLLQSMSAKLFVQKRALQDRDSVSPLGLRNGLLAIKSNQTYVPLWGKHWEGFSIIHTKKCYGFLRLELLEAKANSRCNFPIALDITPVGHGSREKQCKLKCQDAYSAIKPLVSALGILCLLSIHKSNELTH